jgi:hypothetical protein
MAVHTPYDVQTMSRLPADMIPCCPALSSSLCTPVCCM